jgi:hypothetical protein
MAAPHAPPLRTASADSHAGFRVRATPLQGRLNGNGREFEDFLVLQVGVGSAVSASLARQIENAVDCPDRVEGAGVAALERHLARPVVVAPGSLKQIQRGSAVTAFQGRLGTEKEGVVFVDTAVPADGLRARRRWRLCQGAWQNDGQASDHKNSEQPKGELHRGLRKQSMCPALQVDRKPPLFGEAGSRLLKTSAIEQDY